MYKGTFTQFLLTVIVSPFHSSTRGYYPPPSTYVNNVCVYLKVHLKLLGSL